MEDTSRSESEFHSEGAQSLGSAQGLFRLLGSWIRGAPSHLGQVARPDQGRSTLDVEFGVSVAQRTPIRPVYSPLAGPPATPRPAPLIQTDGCRFSDSGRNTRSPMSSSGQNDFSTPRRVPNNRSLIRVTVDGADEKPLSCTRSSLRCLVVTGLLIALPIALGLRSYPLFQSFGSNTRCCDEERAECLACAANLPIAAFCTKKGHTRVKGCEVKGLHPQSPQLLCCEAQIAECLACTANMSIHAFCDNPQHSEVEGCNETHAIVNHTNETHNQQGHHPHCCHEETAKCFACYIGMSIPEYCSKHKDFQVDGCSTTTTTATITTTTTTTTTLKLCCHTEKNSRYIGGDLYTVHGVKSAKVCCKKCQLEPNCTSWTWGKTPTTPDHRMCFLKNQAELKKRHDSDVVSGFSCTDKTTYTIKNRHGICLDSAHRPSVQECSGASDEHQQWSYNRRTGQITNKDGACLDSLVDTYKNGDISLRPCVAKRLTQRWLHDGISGLVKNEHNFCLGAPAVQGTSGEVQMWPCDDNSEKQQWSMWNTQALGERTTANAMQFEAHEPITSGFSLFCFSLMLPWGYEPTLLKMQLAERTSIFACDESAVYSNVVVDLNGLFTRVINTDLHCPLGGNFHTALNTPIFKKVWHQVIMDGTFRSHDWIVKVDPDAVFIPQRLHALVSKPNMTVGQIGNGLFLNNCEFGLHGPLEVLSRRALEVYAAGAPQCEQPPQEDVYLQKCLVKLGVTQLDNFGLLADDHCKSKTWATCQSKHVCFHPFKTLSDYKTCLSKTAQTDG